MTEELLSAVAEMTALLKEIRGDLKARQSVVTVLPAEDAPEAGAKSLLSSLSAGSAGGETPFEGGPYRFLFRTLRNSQADYKTAVTFIQYEPDLKQPLLEFRTEEDSYLLLTGLKFNYLLLKNFYAVFQIYVNDEPLMNPDGYKVLSPFSVTDRIPFLKVIDPGSRVEVYVTLKPFETDIIPDVFILLDQLSQSAGAVLGEDTGVYVLAQSGEQGDVEQWLSDEIVFENIGQYTVHAELDISGGNNYVVNLLWQWLDTNLPDVPVPIDQSPIVLSTTQKNARGRLKYTITYDLGAGPESAPTLHDVRLVQSYARMTLDWGNLTVVNTLVRGVKLPRDVFQNFGETP